MKAIITKTQKEFDNVLNDLHEKGFIWQNGKPLTDRSFMMLHKFPNVVLHLTKNKVSISDRT